MSANKNKKGQLTKQNERLCQELDNERKISKQLRNSLDVMQTGWSLDKSKLTEIIEKLNKPETAIYKNNHKEINVGEKTTVREIVEKTKTKRNCKRAKIMTRSFSKRKILKESDCEIMKVIKIPVNESNLDLTLLKNGIYEKDRGGCNDITNNKKDWDMSTEVPLSNGAYRESEKGMPCPLCCNELFPSQESLKYHLLSILENVFCPVCTRRYDNIMSLVAHLGMTCDGQPRYESDMENEYDSIYKQGLVAKCSDDTFTVPRNTLAVISLKMSNSNTVLNDVLNSVSIVSNNEETSCEPSAELSIKVNQTSDDIQESTENKKQNETESNKQKNMNERIQSTVADTAKYPSDVVNGVHIVPGNRKLHLEGNPALEEETVLVDQTFNSTLEDLSSSIEHSEVTMNHVNSVVEIVNDFDMDSSMVEITEPSSDEYLCSACDMRFTSVADHIVQYHIGEEVQVQGPPEELKNKLSHWNVEDGEISVSLQEECVETYLSSDQCTLTEEDEELSKTTGESNSISNVDECFANNNGYWTKIGLIYKFVNNEKRIRILHPTFVRPDVILSTTNKLNSSRRIRVNGKGGRLWVDRLSLIQLVDDEDLSHCYEKSFRNVNIYVVDEDTPINRDTLGPVAKVICKFPKIKSKNIEANSKGKIGLVKKKMRTHFINLLEVQTGGDKEITIENINFVQLPIIPENIVPFIDKVENPLIPLLEGAKMLKWRCIMCQMSISSVTSVIGHSCYKCEFCDKGLAKNLRVITNHFLKAHPDKDVNLGEIPNVQYITESGNEEYRLENGMADSLELSDVVKVFTCNECKSSFSSQECYKSHLEKIHPTLVECEICKKSILSAGLELHRKWHEENKFACGYCNKTWATDLDLNIHKATHDMKFPHDEEYACTICNKGFANIILLRSHVLQHDGTNRPYACQYCFKRYKRRTEMVIHERIHNNQRPFMCKECGKCFRKQHSLHLHSLRHSGEKLFKCDICEKRFYTNNVLKSHMPTHSLDRPHHCPYCLKCFKTVGRLICHKNRHVLPFKCPYCPLAFSTMVSVRKHVTLHEPNSNALHCPHCPALFRQNYILKQHKKEAHNIEPEPTSVKKQKKERQKKVKEGKNKEDESEKSSLLNKP